LVVDTVGGVWTYGLELTKALASRGVAVVLAALGEPLTPQQREAALASGAQRVYARDCALEWMRCPWGDVERSGDWLLKVAHETDADLVHLNGYAHAALPWHVPVVLGAHSDVLSWHKAVHGRPAGPEWDDYRDAVAAGLRGADTVVAPTAAMLDALADGFAVTRASVVIPNARDPHAFGAMTKEAFVLTAGRVWDDAKNVTALDRVAPRLPWPVLVAGDAGPGRARRLGRVPEPRLRSLLGRAAVFAEPARYEPFGLAALEAGLSGCALVLGDIPSLREVWGDAAAFVDPNDDDALERELLGLIADDRRLHDLGERARRRALEYSPDRLGADYLELYEHLLAEEPLAGRAAGRAA